MNPFRLRSRLARCRGSVLFFTMVLVGTLSIVGLSAYAISRSDIQIVGANQDSVASFHQAEAALHHFKARIEQGLGNGTIQLPAHVDSVHIPAPAGFDTDPLTRIGRTGNPLVYTMRSAGRTRNATTHLEVTFTRQRALDIGIFGHIYARTQPNAEIYSYDSREQLVPSGADDSTGLASVGSNHEVIFQPNTELDGLVLLGDNGFGTPAIYSGPMGHATEHVGHVDPDPLGVNGGPLAQEFTRVAASNQNAAAGITSNQIRQNRSYTLTAGDYYITDAKGGNHRTLTVDATDGPVNIYLAGGFETWPNWNFVLVGRPADFRIFSNSSEDIFIRPNTSFAAFVYAPNADVQIQPNHHFYGVIWGNTVRIQPNGPIWVDTSIQDEFLSNRIRFLSWKEIR